MACAITAKEEKTMLKPYKIAYGAGYRAGFAAAISLNGNPYLPYRQPLQHWLWGGGYVKGFKAKRRAYQRGRP